MFRSAFTIGRVRGIPIRLHVSMLLMVPLIAWSVVAHELGPALLAVGLTPDQLVLPPWVLGVSLAVSLFISVALHELGHALVALRQGGHVRGITLMLIGGVAEIEHEGATPLQQAWMAFAGPLVSILLGVLGMAMTQVPGLLPDAVVAFGLFGAINLSIAVFNLIPAYPLDGGRILKALIQAFTGADRALQLSAALGRILALVALAFALYTRQPMLFIVALFVFMGAGAEEAGAQMRNLLNGLTARQALMRHVATVEPRTPLDVVARHMLVQGAHVALVRDAERIAGVLTTRELRRATGPTAGDVLTGKPVLVAIDDDLAEIARALGRSGQSGAVVFDHFNTIVGVVTTDELSKVAELRIAGRPRPRRPGGQTSPATQPPR